MIDAWSKEAEIRRYEAAAAEDDAAAMATGGGGRGGMVGISSLTTPQYRRKGLLPPPAKPHPSLFSKRSPSPVPAAAAVSTPTAAEKRPLYFPSGPIDGYTVDEVMTNLCKQVFRKIDSLPTEEQSRILKKSKLPFTSMHSCISAIKHSSI
mmetsp:Transcript_19708/g.31295  ORF Transcript_19708/g.31295 Transcript_19708/m.31295 type:complete len:151 (-) Transcript_19708:59-511(-)